MIVVLMCDEIIGEKQNFLQEICVENFVGIQKVHFEYLVQHIENIETLTNLIRHLIKIVTPNYGSQGHANLFLKILEILYLDEVWFIFV